MTLTVTLSFDPLFSGLVSGEEQGNMLVGSIGGMLHNVCECETASNYSIICNHIINDGQIL